MQTKNRWFQCLHSLWLDTITIIISVEDCFRHSFF